MKKSLTEIKLAIDREVFRLNDSAGHNGAMTDYGASALLSRFEFFRAGIMCAYNKECIELTDKDFVVPTEWEKYFISEDPEYIEYQRLKKKFENK